MKNTFYLFISSILIVVLETSLVDTKDTFSQIAENIFSNIKCVPYAYGDFNADKRVDIFCVSKSGKQAEIWLAQEKEPLFDRFKVFSLINDSTIVNIVPGDFNGDSVMDLLIVSRESDYYKMSLFLGNKNSKITNNLQNEIVLKYNIIDQPFIADLNGDGKLDVLIETVDGENIFLIFDNNGEVVGKIELDTPIKLYPGYAHSIADLDNDFKQDLILTSKTGDEIPVFKVLSTSSENKYFLLEEYSAPGTADSIKIYGQSLFADFDSDGALEHLLPVCKDVACTNSAIYIRKFNSIWIELPIYFGSYGFVPPSEAQEFWGENTISVKAGDYNLNGYLDLMAILKENNSSLASSNNERYAILMNNIPSTSSNFTRTFKIDSHIISLFSHKNVVQASFFDLYDDGYLDILLVTKDSSSDEQYQLIGLKNEYYDDVYFLKVMVIPGRCNVGSCPFQSLPYGLNYPGAMVKIESISFDYQKVILYAAQLSQSAYMSLQLPYTIFGLGSTANFVEHLTVGITASQSDNIMSSYHKEWPQIIPNSQLVISPNPRYNTYNWKMQLFITPSKNILMTLISLGSTMILLVILISLLQLREKKMDEKERKLESQRFHFDGL